MYIDNVDYGQICIVHHLPSETDSGLFTMRVGGWHKCNDRYAISHPLGTNNHLLIFTVRGKGNLHLGGVDYTLTPGTIALVPRGMPNSYRTPTGGLWEFYWLHPCGDAADRFLDIVASNGVYVNEFSAEYGYAQRMDDLLNLYFDSRPHDSPLHTSQKLSDLLHHAGIDLCEKKKSLSLSDKAIAYMEQHFYENISLEELARSLFVSTAHLIRTFKKETGKTPHQYLNHYRLLVASQQLEFSDQRVDEISVQLGFSSSSHFISQFRRQFGCTPMQYREEIHGISRTVVPETESFKK